MNYDIYLRSVSLRQRELMQWTGGPASLDDSERGRVRND
jgi:hypothetical protein